MVNKIIVRELLVSSYSKDELKTIATDIAGNAELVFSDGGTLETWARELVSWCGRQNKIQLLIVEIKKSRPEAYKEIEKKLDDKSESPLAEVQSAGEEIEEAFGALRAGGIKKEPVTPETTQRRKTKHPLAGNQISVRTWFKKLDPEQQVFVVSAALFDGLQKDELMYLYSNVLRVLGISKATEKKAED